MKQKLLTIVLACIMAKMFLADLIKGFKNELLGKKEYSQVSFNNCEDRAKKIIFDALKRVIAFYGCCIAFHREDCHCEDHTNELEKFKDELSPKDYKKATTRGWWLG